MKITVGEIIIYWTFIKGRYWINLFFKLAKFVHNKFYTDSVITMVTIDPNKIHGRGGHLREPARGKNHAYTQATVKNEAKLRKKRDDHGSHQHVKTVLNER